MEHGVEGEKALDRPRIHFTAKAGWINDPLGLTYINGSYHLFYQYVPGKLQWAPEQNWGHATSKDALHWTEREVALAPGEGDGGVWSGSLIPRSDGNATIYYTSVDIHDTTLGEIRVAHSTNQQWNDWTKGPVVARLPENNDVLAFRDPFVFHDGSRWRMLVGTGYSDGTAAAVSYVSSDQEEWEYDGIFASRDVEEETPVWTGAVWECPQIMQVGEKWVLTVSVWEPDCPHYEAYAIGEIVEGEFLAETWGRLTYGPSYYAGSVWRGKDGEQGLIYWLREVPEHAVDWASAHSVPHSIDIIDGRLHVAPCSELFSCRKFSGTAMNGEEVILKTDSSHMIEWHTAGTSELSLKNSKGQELVKFIVESGDLIVETHEKAYQMPIDSDELSLLIDRSVIEVFDSGSTLAFPFSCKQNTVLLLETFTRADMYHIS